MTPDDRDRLRELAEGATRGPWVVVGEFDSIGLGIERHEEPDPHAITYPPGPYFPPTPSDAAFIAAAHPQAVLALLDDLRDAEARVARAVDAFNRYGRHDGGCDYRWSGECTCGLLAYRAALAPDETGGAGG
jgi:hypothetical protein